MNQYMNGPPGGMYQPPGGMNQPIPAFPPPMQGQPTFNGSTPGLIPTATGLYGQGKVNVPPTSSVQNGMPTNSFNAGPQGDQFGQPRNSMQGLPLPGQQQPRMSMPGTPPPPVGQVIGQMGGMSLGTRPPFMGPRGAGQPIGTPASYSSTGGPMPPTSIQQTGQYQPPHSSTPPMSMAGNFRPPSSHSAMPPASMGGMPPIQGGVMPVRPQAGIMPNQHGLPPNSAGGMPSSIAQHGVNPPSFAMVPPTSQQGVSQQSYGIPPTVPPHSAGSGILQPQHGMPPVSQHGVPPYSQHGMPPVGQHGIPPVSQHGAPPHPGMPPPPSQSGMPPPAPYGAGPTPQFGSAPGGYQQAQSSQPQLPMQPPSSTLVGGPYMNMPPSPGPQSAQQMQFGGPAQQPGSGYGQNMSGVPGAMNAQQPYGQPNQPSFGGGQRPITGAVQPQQQPRRLDPDQMPSPIQVIEDDKKSRGGLFQTGQRGIVPPLVTTPFICEDQGICSPRFMRSSMYNVPCTGDVRKSSQIPFVVSISPFAKLHDRERSPPLVDFGQQLGPVRCKRCKAYMCPLMQFIDGGRRFQCPFCTFATDVPQEYFAHLDHTGRRTDYFDRPELSLGSYEMVATTDYCKGGKFPNPPAFIFMLDVSYNAVRCGLVHLFCDRLKDEILPNLPRDPNMDEAEIRIGFVTYSKELHFYNLKGNLAQPQMQVVADINDVFVPLVDGFLVRLSESEALIDSLLQQIPVMFEETRETEIVLGPVIQAGLDALAAADCSGKLYIFHSSLPTAEAPGKLKNRDDRKLLGTDKEKTILTPQIPFYTKLGQDCVAAGCGVDIFLFPNNYIDVATVAEVPRLTGGDLYKYMYFQADLDGDRFIEDLKNNVKRPIGFDGVMRIRTSTGIRPTDFLGNFYMSNTTDIELATVDSDKTIVVEIKHDDKLNEAEGASVQAALLYTSVGGQRRLRIFNLALNSCLQMADLFRNCELDVLVNYYAKFAIRELLNTNPKQVRETLMNVCANTLACYRKNCANPSSAGQLILPECMKLLPVYTNCLIKSSALQGPDISTDDRSYIMHCLNAMGIKDSQVFFYPRLIPLHDVDMDSTAIPVAIRCSYERLSDNGVYLLENGMLMFMWVGLNVSPEWVQNVFGVQSPAQIDIDKSMLHDIDNELSRRIRGIVKRVRDERKRYMKLAIIRQRDKLEPVFQQYLAEDRGSGGSSSYVDFLCHIHKEIRNLLS